jgi:long-chain acyl-CoA synthetase
MDWSSHQSLPAMRLESRFGDRVVEAFVDRPKSIWEMVEAAAARNPDGDALICGERRLRWRDVASQAAQVAAGLRDKGLQRGDRIALLLGNRIEFVL